MTSISVIRTFAYIIFAMWNGEWGMTYLPEEAHAWLRHADLLCNAIMSRQVSLAKGCLDRVACTWLSGHACIYRLLSLSLSTSDKMCSIDINRITFGLATRFGDDLTVCPAGQQLWLISKDIVKPWTVEGDDIRMRLLGVRQFDGVSQRGLSGQGQLPTAIDSIDSSHACRYPRSKPR